MLRSYNLRKVTTHSAKLRPEKVLRTFPKNVLMSAERPHMVLYVTPGDTSATGRPWDVLRTSHKKSF